MNAAVINNKFVHGFWISLIVFVLGTFGAGTWDPLNIMDVGYILFGFLVFDGISSSGHWMFHKINSPVHFPHHSKFVFYYQSFSEHLMYIASGVLGWASTGIQTLWGFVAIIAMAYIFTMFGHSNTPGGRWHKKHHQRGNVNFSFTRYWDWIAGTDSSGWPNLRKFLLHTWYLNLTAVGVFLIVCLISNIINTFMVRSLL